MFYKLPECSPAPTRQTNPWGLFYSWLLILINSQQNGPPLYLYRMAHKCPQESIYIVQARSASSLLIKASLPVSPPFCTLSLSSSKALTVHGCHSLFPSPAIRTKCSSRILQGQTLLFQTLFSRAFCTSLPPWYSSCPCSNSAVLQKRSLVPYPGFVYIISTSPSRIARHPRLAASRYNYLKLPIVSFRKICSCNDAFCPSLHAIEKPSIDSSITKSIVFSPSQTRLGSYLSILLRSSDVKEPLPESRRTISFTIRSLFLVTSITLAVSNIPDVHCWECFCLQVWCVH